MKILIGIMSILMVSCVSLHKDKNHLNDWKLFSQLELGKDSQEDVKRKLGIPDEIAIEELGQDEEQWSYMRKGIPKLKVLFVKNIVQFSWMSVWDDEAIVDIAHLLKELSGNWSFFSEEPTSSHHMPFLCYLVDKKNGKKIEVHAYKKIVESISRWNPGVPQDKQKIVKKIPDVDGNRCAWIATVLEKNTVTGP